MFLELFAGLSFFQGFTPKQIEELSPILDIIACEKDGIIFEQNQCTDYLYVLEEGEVEILYKPYDGPALVVARIHPGGVFGWSAVLGRDVYTSGALALEAGRAIRMRKDALQQFCSQHPETGKILLERLASIISERLKSTYSEVLIILTKGLDSNKDGWRRMDKP